MQAELLELKARYGHQLHLRKAPAGSNTSPFPILISWTLEAPKAADAYDVSSVKVLHQVVLQTLLVKVTVCSQLKRFAGYCDSQGRPWQTRLTRYRRYDDLLCVTQFLSVSMHQAILVSHS